MAVRHNQMATLQYVLTNYPSRSECIATEAVTQNNVRMLECVLKHGCEVTVRTWRAAMAPHRYDCLFYLLKSFPTIGSLCFLEDTGVVDAARILFLTRNCRICSERRQYGVH